MLVEGNLANLKQSTLKFRNPQRYIPERRNFNQIDDDAKSTYSYVKNGNFIIFSFLNK